MIPSRRTPHDSEGGKPRASGDDPGEYPRYTEAAP